MQLIHYSSAPLERVESVEQTPERLWLKPSGLWFSAGDGDDGWRAWCEAEEFMLGNLKHRTEIVLATTAKMLRLSSANDIDQFNEQYGASRQGVATIDWAKVAEKHDGIIIAPYIWERRLGGPIWYYTWDCASGCVWNAGAVQELRPVGSIQRFT